jgi:hypothetical protein
MSKPWLPRAVGIGFNPEEAFLEHARAEVSILEDGSASRTVEEHPDDRKTFFDRCNLREAVSEMIAAVLLVGPMLLAAVGVVGLLFLVGAGSNWLWFAWVIVMPVAYLSWVILYLAICALVTRQMGKRYPKPRQFVMRPGQRSSREGLGLWTAVLCYCALDVIEALPFARAMAWIPGLRTLWMYAYSPTLHFGTNVINSGTILDPDLTEIGDNSVIGRGALLSAHTMAARADGTLVFKSAPIKVGQRVTLGAQSRVARGCIIGDDAGLEPRTVVAPFTQIPAGEVWGGNPALFLRKRHSAEVAQRGAKTA